MLANGEPITNVSRWLGHSSVDFTYKRYARYIPDQAAAAAMDRQAALYESGLRLVVA